MASVNQPPADGASADNLDVDPDVLDRLGVKVVSLSDDFANAGEELDKQVTALLDVWIGKSATAYGPVYREWYDRSKSISARLEELGLGLRQASSNYRDTENENQSGFHNLRKPGLNL